MKINVDDNLVNTKHHFYYPKDDELMNKTRWELGDAPPSDFQTYRSAVAMAQGLYEAKDDEALYAKEWHHFVYKDFFVKELFSKFIDPTVFEKLTVEQQAEVNVRIKVIYPAIWETLIRHNRPQVAKFFYENQANITLGIPFENDDIFYDIFPLYKDLRLYSNPKGWVEERSYLMRKRIKELEIALMR